MFHILYIFILIYCLVSLAYSCIYSIHLDKRNMGARMQMENSKKLCGLRCTFSSRIGCYGYRFPPVVLWKSNSGILLFFKLKSFFYFILKQIETRYGRFWTISAYLDTLNTHKPQTRAYRRKIYRRFHFFGSEFPLRRLQNIVTKRTSGSDKTLILKDKQSSCMPTCRYIYIYI